MWMTYVNKDHVTCYGQKILKQKRQQFMLTALKFVTIRLVKMVKRNKLCLPFVLNMSLVLKKPEYCTSAQSPYENNFLFGTVILKIISRCQRSEMMYLIVSTL